MSTKLEDGLYFNPDNFLSRPKQIGPHIYTINGENTHITTANGCLAGNIIFDPGSLTSYPHLLRNLLSVVGSLNQEFLICITHPHLDHVQSTSKLRRDILTAGGKVRVYAPKGAKDIIAESNVLTTATFLYPHSLFVPFRIDRELRDGEEFSLGDLNVQAIMASGHSPCDMCYLIKDHGVSVLITGDALIGNGIGEKTIGSNFDEYLDAQRKLSSHLGNGSTSILEGHGNPLIPLSVEGFKSKFSHGHFARSDLRPGFKELLSLAYA